MPISSTIAESAQPAPRFRDLNAGKANFDEAYDRPDPRAYAAVLGKLGYCVPSEALPVFRRIIAARRAEAGRAALRIADIGCSFGINAALLKHDVSLRTFFARYRTTPLKDMPNGLLIRSDREFFAHTLDDSDLSFVGLDVSAPAIDYAERVGLLDGGISEDLEKEAPSPVAQATLRDLDLVITTGCVGYVGERTFERVLECQDGGQPWIASFVLRMFPYDRIVASLAQRGYVTEKLQGRFFAQRRCANAAEMMHMVEALKRRALVPLSQEQDGMFMAEFFLSRPAAEARAMPLARLMSGPS